MKSEIVLAVMREALRFIFMFLVLFGNADTKIPCAVVIAALIVSDAIKDYGRQL